MKVLLAGAAGFIASAVARRLLAAGHDVVGLDDLNDAYDVRLKEWRLERLLERRGFSFVRCDVSDLPALEAGWAGRGPFDAVVDLAARAGVRQSLEDPWTYLRTNATGTLNLLELCRRSGAGRLVLSSSSSVYGASEALPWREDARTGAPLSPYAASKIAAEAIAHSYHHLHGLDVTVLRYFTVYGPAGRPDMSAFRFVRWIVEGDDVVLHGDGRQARDFTYVEDVAAGTVSSLSLQGFNTVNLGSSAPVSLLELVGAVEKATGRSARLRFEPKGAADVGRTWASVDRAREILGWQPRTSLAEGVAACVEWYVAEREWASLLKL